MPIIASRKLVLLVAATVLALSGAAFAGEEPDDTNTATHPESPTFVVIGGTDRYETAAQVALQSFPRDAVEILYVANGETLVDALVVGVTTDSPSKMLLVRRDSVPEPTRDALRQIKAWKVVFVGGDGAISPETRAEVMSLIERY